MSGLSNVDKPSSIRGIKGNEMQLKNFAFTSESGFGEGNYEGGLVFDGVDDIAYIENFDTLIGEEKIYTVIGNYTNISTRQSLFFNLYNRHSIGSFIRVSSKPVSIDINYTRSYTVNFETGKVLYKDLLNTESVTSNFPVNIIPDAFSLNGYPYSKGLNEWVELSQVAYYYLGIYRGILTPEEIETEKERLNEEWLKRSKVTIPEPDVYYDLSLKDNSSPTRNIMDDLSGNGHDAEIFNAAYTESSGYRSDGAFVFDSIDDYAIMQNVTKGFKTLFMEVIPSLTTDKGGFLYDQRVGQTGFGINISLNHIAYNTYNWGGVTYINGKLNTTMNGKEVYLKHQIITIVNGTDLKPQKVVLGGDIGLAGYFSNMALYKLIGFYDELTPLQIEKVINDYKLKHD